MAPTQISSRDFELLRKEVEALGESMNQERLDRVASVDKLKLEFEALKAALKQMHPDFDRLYAEAYADQVQNFDPEAKAG